MSEEPYYLDDTGPRLACPYAVTRGAPNPPSTCPSRR